jgi:hypothetical protein
VEHDETRFLPPEPAGPEPDLSARPQPQQTYGYPPPPPGYGHQPPPQQPQQQQPQQWQQPAPPPWGYPQPPVPDNGQAVTGFVFSLVSIGLLVVSAGLSTIVSLGCAIVGIVCGRNGKRKVDAGETPKHRGLAQAGYIIGWVSLGLSILATIAWILVVVFAATDGGDPGDGIVVLRAGAWLVGG